VSLYTALHGFNPFGGPRKRKHAIVTFSDRQELHALTRPSLQQFVAARSERYDLLVGDEALLDERDFHPAWNKLAWLRRVLVAGLRQFHHKYDVVFWFDDDVVITNHHVDRLHDLAMQHLLCPKCNKLVLASRDDIVNEDIPSGGIFGVRRCHDAIALIDALFKIGRRPRLLDSDVQRLPRRFGRLEQDAFATYIRAHGKRHFALVEHGTLQSTVRPGRSGWRPGDFAAHIVGAPTLEERLRLVSGIVEDLAAA